MKACGAQLCEVDVHYKGLAHPHDNTFIMVCLNLSFDAHTEKKGGTDLCLHINIKIIVRVKILNISLLKYELGPALMS